MTISIIKRSATWINSENIFYLNLTAYWKDITILIFVFFRNIIIYRSAAI